MSDAFVMVVTSGDKVGTVSVTVGGKGNLCFYTDSTAVEMESFWIARSQLDDLIRWLDE